MKLFISQCTYFATLNVLIRRTVKAHIQFFDIFLAPKYAGDGRSGGGGGSKGEYDAGCLSEQNNADSAVETVQWRQWGGGGGGVGRGYSFVCG